MRAMGGVAWATWLWLAATWRVDGDATACPGDGSEDTPFCTLQDAFDNPALAGGDEIVVRDAATAYAGGEVTSVDGSAGAPIVLRPDDGHAPRIGGMVELTASSYWIVRGLTFDAGGGQPGHTAIAVTTGAEVVEGIVVENNTIVGWSGALITAPENGFSGGIISISSYPGTQPRAMLEPIVRGNRIVGGRGKAIFVTNTVGGTIEGNDIAELGCQMETNGPGIIGIHVDDTDGSVVARNRIRDFDASVCSLGGERRVTGVWLQGARDIEVHHNLVQRLGGQAQTGAGINLIHRADDCRIHHNVVVDADQCGLCNGVQGSNGGDRARFVANTVIGGRGNGLELVSGEDTEFLGNVVVGAAEAQVRILRTAEITFEGGVSTWVFDGNLYLPAPGEDNIARFEFSAPVDFESWSSECGCDASTIVADPMFPAGGAEDFTAATNSPIVDAGVELPEIEAWNGDGVDLGAVEAPLFVSASIAAEDPDTIRVVLQSETSALRHDPSCSGFAIEIDDAPVAAVACDLEGDAIAVRLAEPAHAGDTVVLAYAGSSISNSDAIGGVVHGLLQPFEIDVDNGSQEMPPDESGDVDSDGSAGEPTTDASGSSDASASGTPSTTAASEGDTDGTGASYPGVDGCSCSSRPRAWPLFIALLPFAFRRRRAIRNRGRARAACSSSRGRC